MWELDYFVAEMFCDADIPTAAALETATMFLAFANRAGAFMEIVPSTEPGRGKWEKRSFIFKDFQEDRMSECVKNVRKSRGLDAPVAKQEKSEDAPVAEAPAEEAPASTEE